MTPSARAPVQKCVHTAHESTQRATRNWLYTLASCALVSCAVPGAASREAYAPLPSSAASILPSIASSAAAAAASSPARSAPITATVPSAVSSVEQPSTQADCIVPDAPAADTSDISLETDLPYGVLARHSYDFAAPRTGSRRGIVVIVHGGGWTSGSKRLFTATLRLLAHEGFAAAAVNYRLTANAASAYPHNVEDVRCGMHTIFNRAVALGHHDNMVLIGASAGGHLAMLAGSPNAATNFDKPECASHSAMQVRGVVAYYPPLLLDTARARYVPKMQQAVDELLRASSPGAWQQAAAAASLPAHLTAGFAPALLLHGTRDPIVPVTDSRQAITQLRALGNSAELVELDTTVHGFAVLGAAASIRPATCAAWQHIRRYAQ
jgi:acetyl esterase/lipase